MKVSVIIPTYNRRHILATAIDSVLASEGFAPGEVEVLVVDDGSTDGTVDWLNTAYAGRPVRVLRNRGAKGPAGGRNTGLAEAQGALVGLLDSDDAYLPHHLAQARAVFERHADVDVVFGRARYTHRGEEVPYMGPAFEHKLAASPQRHADADVVVFGPGFASSLLQQGCWFNLSSVVMRRNAAQARMEESLRVAEDWEFWARLARRHGFACLRAPQIVYTLGDDNISFEADHVPAGHSEQLLRALGCMAAYPDLTPEERAVLADQQAGVLFDWAWRCSQAGDRRQAWALHRRSMAHGRRGANLRALAKLLLPRGPAARPSSS